MQTPATSTSKAQSFQTRSVQGFGLKPLVAAAIVLSLPAFAQDAPDRAARIARIRTSLVDKTNSVDQEMDTAKAGNMEIRDLTNGALVAAHVRNYAQAERLYRLAFDEQDMMAGEDLGKMPWKKKDRKINDANSIDFATESTGPLLLAYAKEFTPAFQKYLVDHARASLVRLAGHKIPVSYSNIYTMNFSNTILIAEALGDKAMMQRGYQNMDTWLDYTGRAGLHEFDSPIYNSVVLSALMMVFQYSSSPHAHAKAAEALKYVWTDLAANYFPAGRELSGPASRAYNFLYSTGNIDCYYFWQGFQNDFSGQLPLERAYLLEATLPEGYLSPVKPFPADIDRLVTQRYDEAPEKYRINYVTPSFAIGVANGNYGPQDKMFAIDFAPPAGKKEFPNVYIATTTTGLPYGKDKSTDKGGHSKPHHLKNNLGAIQDGGLALLVADPDPHDTEDAKLVYVDMVFPADGQLTIGDHSFSSTSTADHVLGANDTLGLRIGNSCLAVRPILPEKSVTQLHLIVDDGGKEEHVFRLAAFVSHGVTQLGYLVYTAPCEGKGNSSTAALTSAQVKQTLSGHTWTIDSATQTLSGKTALSLDYDLSKFAAPSARVNGEPFATPALRVNVLRVPSATP